MGRIDSEWPVNPMTNCYTDRPRKFTTRRTAVNIWWLRNLTHRVWYLGKFGSIASVIEVEQQLSFLLNFVRTHRPRRLAGAIAAPT